MDNSVGKCVYNFEDNCVENRQKVESQTPQWIATWAEFMLKQSSTELKLNENSLKLIEQILLATTRGDSCLAKGQLSFELLGELVIEEASATHTVAPFIYDQDHFYLYRYWQLEQRLALQIQRLKSQNIQPVAIDQFDHLLEDQHQKNALKMVAKQGLNIITGGPGTGKTYTLARIIAVLNHAMPNIRIAMAAPTGKAAQRMKEALQNSFSDEHLNAMGLVSDHLKQQDTVTIHRLLGLGTRYQPRFHLKQPLPYDVIVIDEASMLDLNLATLLLEAVPDQCRLILLGDANQLASVDVGSVLADLRQVQALDENHVNLVTSRRFKAGALIGELAGLIQTPRDAQTTHREILESLENKIVQASEIKAIPLIKAMADVVQLEYLPEQINVEALQQYYQKLSWGFHDYFAALKNYIESDDANHHVEKVIHAFDQYRILTAIRHGDFGLSKVNDAMQKALLNQLPLLVKRGDWYVGRPVMMSYNDYQLGLSNGDIGLCFKHRTNHKEFEVYFPSLDKWIPATRLPKSIETAFALTIHKSQGSEFTHTAVVLDEASTKLLSQELIYTAVTRAKSVVSLLVNPDALAQSFLVETIRSSGLVNKINHLSLSNR